jgi:hypothetical protein
VTYLRRVLVLLVTVILLLVPATSTAHHGFTHPFEDRWRAYRHLDCESLADTIKKLQGHLIWLAWTEADPVTYQTYYRKLKEVRRVRNGVCTPV